MYRENNVGVLKRSCLWIFIEYQETVNYKHRISWALSITFKPVDRTTLENPWDKLQSLLQMKLITDVTLLFFSVVDMIF